jgi:hypothetical protein
MAKVYDWKKTAKKAGVVLTLFLLTGAIAAFSAGGEFSHFAYAGVAAGVLESLRDMLKHGAFE